MAIAWGVVFVGVAELTQDPANPTLLGSRGIIRPRRGSVGLASASEMRTSAEGAPSTRTPGWLNVLGIVALIPIVLFFALPVFGGGAPGGHAPGQGPGQSGATSSGGNTPPIEGAPEVAVTADQLAFDVDRIELSGGQPVINVALTSVDTLHDLTVDKIGFHVAADRGETVVGGMQGISFGEPGTYFGYCSVPGHREASMEIEIVVTAGEH